MVSLTDFCQHCIRTTVTPCNFRNWGCPNRLVQVCRDKIKSLATLGLGFEPCTKSDVVDVGLELQSRYGLLTNDSVILAIAMRLDADALVSAGARFQVGKDIRVYAPSDITLMWMTLRHINGWKGGSRKDAFSALPVDHDHVHGISPLSLILLPLSFIP